MGQQVIVDNRGDRVAQEIVAKSVPDGYTLHVTGTGFWVEPLLRKLSYDPIKDFSPITLATTSPNVLVVHPSFAAKSVKDLIALAKAKPGALNYASSGTGGAAHLAGELFKSMAGVNIVHVAYKGASAGLTGLMGGETQLMFPTAGSVVGIIKSGKLTAVAVTSCSAIRASAGSAYDSGVGPARLRIGRYGQRICAFQNACGAHQSIEPGDGAAPQQGGGERAVVQHRRRGRGQFSGTVGRQGETGNGDGSAR